MHSSSIKIQDRGASQIMDRGGCTCVSFVLEKLKVKSEKYFLLKLIYNNSGIYN